ncbi:MAG: efflux RND transporter permease subunit [Woeseiaceae bacterium]|nr:efflux RND transporter permease subunit [Woeseiaceae bacterium]
MIRGAHRVAIAATFGVLTTIAAFAPMLFLDGIFAPFFSAMSVVVILCLLFSLVESKLILPAHLANARIPEVDEAAIFRPYREMRPLERVQRFFQRIQRRTQHGLRHVIEERYAPLLGKALDNRGVTISLFIGLLIVTVGLMKGGIARTVIFPDVPGDFIQAQLTMQSRDRAGTSQRGPDADRTGAAGFQRGLRGRTSGRIEAGAPRWRVHQRRYRRHAVRRDADGRGQAVAGYRDHRALARAGR